MPIQKNWYDSVTNQTNTMVYIDRHWSLEDICLTSTNDSVQKVNQEIINAVPESSEKKDYFKVYPNPTTGKVNFKYTSTKPENSKITINDLTGRKLEEIALDPSSPGENFSTYDFSGFPSGTYVVKSISAGSVCTVKLVIW